jgi:hypothetical protein
MKRPLFAQRSDDSRSPSPSDESSADPRHPKILSSPHPSSKVPEGSDAGFNEDSLGSGSGSLKEVRGTPGPIRVDEGSVACVIEQRLPSSCDSTVRRPSDIRVDAALLRSNWTVDPQVLEFCAWLERTASLGVTSSTAPQAAPFQLGSAGIESRQVKQPLEKQFLSTSCPELDHTPVPVRPSSAHRNTPTPDLISSARDAPVAAPFRRYDCHNYQVCLDVAAALDWENFTCSSCNGQVDKRLLWRAKHAQRRDPFAKECCDLPDLEGDTAPLILGPAPRPSKKTSLPRGRRGPR